VAEAARSTAPGAGFDMRLEGANPGRESRLEFTVPAATRVSLKVYDVQGRVVRTLVDQDAAPGTFRAQWDGRDDGGARASRGVYFARLVAGNQTTEKKLVLE
jgi:flagellar hook assembly protein FlgD